MCFDAFFTNIISMISRHISRHIYILHPTAIPWSQLNPSIY